MKTNRLKERMLARETGLLNAWLVLGSPAVAEVVARQPWDSVTIDMQHGLSDFESTVAMLRAMQGTDPTPMVRVPWLEPGLIQKVLDAGAFGVICPMVNTQAQCEQFVSVCRYAPAGSRSFGPTRAPLVAGADYWRHANDNVLTFAMIETRQAVEALEGILSVPGLDGIYIGPADLSLSLGLDPIAGLQHPMLLETIERIRVAAERAGKFAVMHCSPVDYAVFMADKGFSLRTVSNDGRLLTMAAEQVFKTVRAASAPTAAAGY